ncbi:MAG: phosphoribosylglycinamide synthetase C domain-containing protein, partial [Lactococcus lactis]|nr:phosphoribosylglycinamide synthetase C domain-containing protein [Lactococcus lactis]
VLYAGLILTADGVKTIEFNARFGDPETQVVLPRLKSDLAQAIIDILAGDVPTLEWLETGVTLGVVVASEGYPAQAKTGSILPDIPKELNVYYAGVTENEANQLVSSGGRVYLLSESGKDIASTQKSLYDKLDKLDNQGLFYRHDIGSKAVK